jgi:hypothetical protein
MNDERRLLLKEKLAQLGQIKESLNNVWVDEEARYESRSTGFKETGQGVSSVEAIKDLEEAVFCIEDACEALRGIVSEP